MADLRKRAAVALIGISPPCGYVLPCPAQKTTIYSLTELVDSANRHLPLLLEKQALVESARAGITEAKHSFLPQVNAVEELSAGSANDLTGPYLPVPGVIHPIGGGIDAANNYQAVTGNMASLYGQYDLVTFGLKDARVQRPSLCGSHTGGSGKGALSHQMGYRQALLQHPQPPLSVGR